MTLILGGSGQLGTEMRQLLPDAAAPTRRDFDLADIQGIERRLDAFEPSAIINCAAYTRVDDAEADEPMATLVNGEAVGKLAAAAHKRGIPFVTFSTDYVFDGKADRPYVESSVTAPRNAYGRSKVVGERLALGFPGSLVIRTSWLVSSTHPNFVSAVLAKARRGPLRVVGDEWGSPTLVSDLGPLAVTAMTTGANGVLHLAGRPVATRFDLATTALAAQGLDPKLVVSCSAQEYPRPAERPRFSALESERLGILGIDRLPDWRIGIQELAG